MARTQTITVGDHFNHLIEGLISSGRYTSVSEVIRESLRLLEEKEAGSKLERLRQALIEGEQSGTPRETDFDKLLEKAKGEARKRGQL